MTYIIFRHLAGSKINQTDRVNLDDASELTLGRDPSCLIAYDPNRDGVVSRRHAVIRVIKAEKLGFTLKDLNSTNGTFLDGQKVTAEIELLPGQTIELGTGGPKLVFDVEPRPAHLAARMRMIKQPVGRETLLSDTAALASQQTDSYISLSKSQADSLLLLPQKEAQTDLNIEALRTPGEKTCLMLIYIFNVVVFLIFAILAFNDPVTAAVIASIALSIVIINWISIKLIYAWILGDGIEVSQHQYPQIFSVVKAAATKMLVDQPRVVVLQGHGLFEIMVARRFIKRGIIIVTSNFLEEFAELHTSREFMFFIGRQLGHIKAGHFKYWFFTEVIGRFSFLLYFAWQRRCHLTADKIGMLVAGDAHAAVQALCIITVGGKIAPSTNIEQVMQQRERYEDSFWSWLRHILSTYPYMIDRILRIQKYAEKVIGEKRPDVGAIGIDYSPLRSVPILIIHGRDHVALLELKDFLYSKFPFVVPQVMMTTTAAAMSLPEKFEVLSRDAVGAIAIMTPDDIGGLVQDKAPNGMVRSLPRARQNVVIEIGWAWAKLGRNRCLLLARGNIELPSDFSGVELHSFNNSPSECSEAVREFIESIRNSLRKY